MKFKCAGNVSHFLINGGQGGNSPWTKLENCWRCWPAYEIQMCCSCKNMSSIAWYLNSRSFSAHWNFVSRSTSSMVLELSSGASSPKKQGHLHRWLKNVRCQAIADIFWHFQHIWTSKAGLHLQWFSSLVRGSFSPKKQGHLHRWLKNVRYQAIADIFWHLQHIWTS